MVRGSYNDAVDMAGAACAKFGWDTAAPASTMTRDEGSNNMGFEIAEQLAQHEESEKVRRGESERIHLLTIPLCLILLSVPPPPSSPVGDGNIISGVHKGFYDLHQLGWDQDDAALYRRDGDARAIAVSRMACAS